MATSDDERQAVLHAFRQAVNMTPAALERWLATAESRAVGITHGDGHESVGHHSGRRIVALLRTPARDLGDDDLSHRRKVVGYVHRHLAQRPTGDVHDTRWR